MTTVEIMEQAQVFASSWALVGSRFDSGFEIANAHEQKADLREMIEALAKDAAPAWMPIETEPKDGECVVVYWMEDGDPRFDFDRIEEGSWAKHADYYAHYCMVAEHGMTGPKETPPYTHWMPLPKPPAIEDAQAE